MEATARAIITHFNNITEIPEVLHDDDQRTAEDVCCMRIQTKHEGDYRLSWNPKNPVQVAAAKMMFDSMIAEGMEAFKVSPQVTEKCGECGADKGKATEGKTKLTTFDTNLGENEEFIFVPMKQMVAG